MGETQMKHNSECGLDQHNGSQRSQLPEGYCRAPIPESGVLVQNAQFACANCGRTATSTADLCTPQEPPKTDMKRGVLWRRFAAPALALALTLGGCSGMAPKTEGQLEGKEGQQAQSVHDFTVKSPDGQDIALADYQGKVLLIVNVASKCGFTGQYEGLQKLHEKYQDLGLVVLGFPANDFLGQEPGTNDEIQQFCTLNYGVTFPVFAKISVKGKDMHPLYAFLTSKEANPEFGGAISWNFNKFLIGRDGKILARFGSRTKPEDKKLVEAVEQATQSPSGKQD